MQTFRCRRCNGYSEPNLIRDDDGQGIRVVSIHSSRANGRRLTYRSIWTNLYGHTIFDGHLYVWPGLIGRFLQNSRIAAAHQGNLAMALIERLHENQF